MTAAHTPNLDLKIFSLGRVADDLRSCLPKNLAWGDKVLFRRLIKLKTPTARVVLRSCCEVRRPSQGTPFFFSLLRCLGRDKELRGKNY